MSSDNVVALLNQVLARLSVIEAKIGEGGSSGDVAASSGPALPKSVVAFDAYCTANLDPFVEAYTKLGGDAQVAGNNVKEAWNELRKVILTAANCKEPPQSELPKVLSGLAPKLQGASKLVNRNEWEKHTKTLSEGIGCLNWVCVKPAPRDFIESFVGGSDYYANAIRKEYKTSNPDQIAFCNTFKNLLVELMSYVKEYHTTGLAWNPKGVDVKEFDPSAAASSTVAATNNKPANGAAPAASSAAPSSGAAASTVAKADLFAALNKEGAITSGLKKVTKDMQTWREEYKKPGDVPAPAAKAPVASKAAAAVVMKYPPKLVFEEASSKWQVEYQTAEQGLVTIEIKDKKETVYVLGCVGANIRIVGKCKSIVVDSCKKTNVTFQTVMASCEVVNCQRTNITCEESASAVAIDKTDGIVVTLPRSSLHTEVVASKSSEMNLSWPDENGDMVEKPIPEQYVHRIKGMSVTADVSDLYTH